jgi:hypothetical protein
MDEQRFRNAYNEPRNGANAFYRHMLVRKFQYSAGVQECAEAGCYWLLDILATELKLPVGDMAIVKISVNDGKARITSSLNDDSIDWSRDIHYTDMPDGAWTFYAINEGERVACILPNEY